MSKAADEYEDIARRLKELEADRQLALTGSTAPEPKLEVPAIDTVYGDYAMGWPANGRWADLIGGVSAQFPVTLGYLSKDD